MLGRTVKVAEEAALRGTHGVVLGTTRVGAAKVELGRTEEAALGRTLVAVLGRTVRFVREVGARGGGFDIASRST